MEAPKIGTLYLVATPIGNPDDITFRALKVLKEADLIVCEELKEGEKILSTYQIEPKEIDTLNEHNESLKVEKIINDLKSGNSENEFIKFNLNLSNFAPSNFLFKEAVEGF